MPVFPIDSAARSNPSAAAAVQPRASSHPLLWRIVAWFEMCGDGHIPGARPAIDGCIVLLSFFIAYVVRYDGDFSRPHLQQFLLWSPILVGARLLFIGAAGVHRCLWRFVCLRDALAIARSLAWVTAALLLLRWLYPPQAAFAYWLRLPLGIVVPEFLLSLIGALAIRCLCRIGQERSDRATRDPAKRRKRVLLYGAGRAGVMLVHDLASNGGLEIVGFLDDDPRKRGAAVAGVRVLGAGGALAQIVRRNQVDEVMISIAAPPPGAISRILSACNSIPVKTTIVPPAQEIIAGRVKIGRVREVRIEDLLGRSSAATGECAPQVRAAYQGRRVLVTGAGGSIGSELCRQLLTLKPSLLTILDKDENSIFELEHELRSRDPRVPVEPWIADIKMPERIAALFEEARPQVVVHAAAHKHVPLMERHPCEAVLNNVMGMKNVLDCCRFAGVERFVFISSDKAVNPANVMGATKRVGEKLLAISSSGTRMKSAAVRFGNVLGSRGSVIPLFQRQIEQGGPLTVTHPDMVRFFMTIPEAVQLVLCAGSLASRNETFVLDMGNPRRVLDLARQMIELAGFDPDRDIAIEITGLRPGEKMEEELACMHESLQLTRFEKIFEIPRTEFDEEAFRAQVEILIHLAREGNRLELLDTLQAMGLGYRPKPQPALAAGELNRIAYAS